MEAHGDEAVAVVEIDRVAGEVLTGGERHEGGERAIYDLVGPVCETGDFIGKARDLALAPGDLLAVRGSGAYGFTMSSNNTSRPRAPEVMVDGANIHLVRPRETVASLFAGETLIP